MNIKLQAKISCLSDADLADFPGSIDKIEDACSDLADVLTATYVARHEAHKQYLDRLIHFCHTGK
jgi:hypothetical protein